MNTTDRKPAPFADTPRRREFREAQAAAAERSRTVDSYVLARRVGMPERRAREAAGMPERRACEAAAGMDR